MNGGTDSMVPDLLSIAIAVPAPRVIVAPRGAAIREVCHPGFLKSILEVGMIQPSLDSSRRRRPVGSRRLVRQLPALRKELERQREFRSEQLAHLSAHDQNQASLVGYGPRAMDGDAVRALHQVRALVAAGARQALADIELALARMNQGTYGRCRACDADIPPAVLTAIPKTTLCQACHAPAADTPVTRP
jgi:RNA polymerase-binding transcription factor DksA